MLLIHDHEAETSYGNSTLAKQRTDSNNTIVPLILMEFKCELKYYIV